MHIRLVNMYLLNVPGVSSPYLNKNKTNVSFTEMARLFARNSLICMFLCGDKLNKLKILNAG